MSGELFFSESDLDKRLQVRDFDVHSRLARLDLALRQLAGRGAARRALAVATTARRAADREAAVAAAAARRERDDDAAGVEPPGKKRKTAPPPRRGAADARPSGADCSSARQKKISRSLSMR